MMRQYELEKLSTELLLKIFSYLDIPDLCNLRQSCKRFNEIVNFWDHVLLKNVSPPFVTNQNDYVFSSRCLRQLPILEKIRISKNWQIGRYREKSLLFDKRKYIPWLHLSKNSFWLSRGEKIFNYERRYNYINVARPTLILQGKSTADVGHFHIKNNLLVTGQRDGSIWLSNLNARKVICDIKDCHSSDINSVDISRCGRTIISGSRDNFVKIWRVDYDSQDALNEQHSYTLQDQIWRVSLLDEKPLLAVGTAGNAAINSIFIYDLEKISEVTQLPSTNIGLGVLDLRWDGPHTIWSCGYDSYLKRWDLRSGRCEQKFCDPHASALYCLDYDYVNTIMTGTQQHGRVILWDIRQRNCVQLYFMESCKNRRYRRNSPIYSLAFDAEYLFTATDQNLNVLNFSVYGGNINDYSDCCR